MRPREIIYEKHQRSYDFEAGSCFFWFVALVVVRLGYAGEYYIYQDSNGKLVISNYAPPPGSNVIKKETLSEVTDQQIIESQLRENRLALDNRLSNLEKNVSELTENLRTQDDSHKQRAGGGLRR